VGVSLVDEMSVFVGFVVAVVLERAVMVFPWHLCVLQNRFCVFFLLV
jgi:hypothetical protein